MKTRTEMFRDFQRFVSFDKKEPNPKKDALPGMYVAEYDGIRDVGDETGRMFRTYRKHQLDKEGK